MASCSKSNCAAESEFLLVNNIPKSYHSKDLRRYFAEFLEADKFVCFHYVHRPQKKRERASELNDQLATESNSKSTVHNAASKSKRKSSARCCVVCVKDESLCRQLLADYHCKRWTGADGKAIALRCFITRIKLAGAAIIVREMNEGQTTEPEVLQSNRLHLSELETMPEMRPPSLMPKGNVGTPTQHFLNLINQCRLPPKVVKNLGLDFTTIARRRKRPYSAMTMLYNQGTRARPITQQEQDSNDWIPGDDDDVIPKDTDRLQGASEDSDGSEEWDRHEAFYDDVTTQGRTKERLYEENMEVVWEKGGPGLVFYTDAFYWNEAEGPEEDQWHDDWDLDMSVYYEKGQGDMDARQMIDMRRNQAVQSGEVSDSVFRTRKQTDEVPATHKRTRTHSDTQCSSSTRLGDFEKHTKAIGTKVLERAGWKLGAGLGAVGREGKPFAVADGMHESSQPAHAHKGLGYYGVQERREHHNALERKRRDHIKDSFDSLRHVVPAADLDSKSSRSMILKRAAEHIVNTRLQLDNKRKDIDLIQEQNTELQRQIDILEQAQALDATLARQNQSHKANNNKNVRQSNSPPEADTSTNIIQTT